MKLYNGWIQLRLGLENILFEPRFEPQYVKQNLCYILPDESVESVDREGG